MRKWSHLGKIFRSGEQPLKKCTCVLPPPLTNLPFGSMRLSNFANFILWSPQIPKCPSRRISSNLKSWCRTSNWALTLHSLSELTIKGLKLISKSIHLFHSFWPLCVGGYYVPGNTKTKNHILQQTSICIYRIPMFTVMLIGFLGYNLYNLLVIFRCCIFRCVFQYLVVGIPNTGARQQTPSYSRAEKQPQHISVRKYEFPKYFQRQI